MNIFLACNAGLSTNILVQKMQEAAEQNGYSNMTIEAFPVELMEERLDEADIVLLGPQIRHLLDEVKNLAEGKCKVDVIDMRDYGMIRGDKVFEQALRILEEK